MTATACPLAPLDDRIVARELPLPDIPDDAMWLPERTAGPTRAVVVAAGPGRRTDHGVLMPPTAQVGDVVLLARYGPTEIEVDGETLLCATPMLVLAVEH